MPESSPPLTLDDFWSLRLVSDARVSPDGLSVAYVVARADEESNEMRSAIWLVDLSSGRARQITNGEAQDSAPRWSPDGGRLAFVSTRHEKKSQIFIVEAGGGEAVRLTKAQHGAHTPVWAPDGTHICFSSTLPSERQKVTRETEWFDKHQNADRSRSLRRQTGLWSRMDMRGWYENRTHLFVLPLDGTDEARQLTSGDWDALEPDWSPDGELIAFVTNDVPNWEFTMLTADLRTVRVADETLTTLTNGTLSLGTPSWSPDGSTIAFYGSVQGSSGYENRHVWTVSRAGGALRDRVPDLDRPCGSAFQGDYMAHAFSRPAWSSDGSTLYFNVLDGGVNSLHALTLSDDSLRRVSSGQGDVQSIGLVPGGALAVCVAATPTRPYEVCTVSLSGGAPAPLTASNAKLLSGHATVSPEHIQFRGPNDLDIEGWLYAPPGTPGPYPLILNVHGGPNGSWGTTFYFQAQALAGAGYGVLYLNPRGSGGYGKAFADRADWGQLDFQDLMTGLDLVVNRGDADPRRLGVTGISYGGFMTNWTVSHTDRFAAGVAVNGVSNFVTMFGVSDITAVWFQQKYGDHFGGPFWQDDATWARYRERSPLSHVESIHTPLLLIQAENDYRCPIDQGEQMLTALRVLGQPVELIRFPGCSHAIVNTGTPLQRYLQWAVALDWFDTYVNKEAPVEAREVLEAVPAD